MNTTSTPGSLMIFNVSGLVTAALLSYRRNQSIPLAMFHALFGWFYCIYWLIVTYLENAAEEEKMDRWDRYAKHNWSHLSECQQEFLKGINRLAEKRGCSYCENPY
jgi:hypothetical protein